MVAVGGSALAVVGAFWAGRRDAARAAAGLARLARLGALASLALVAFSVVFHLVTGHPPGSPRAMGAGSFVDEHPAFMVVLLLAVIVLWWLRQDET